MGVPSSRYAPVFPLPPLCGIVPGFAHLKKTKLETSTVSSTKVQIPKAKLGDKITALQQIVSPFGKTDTASVLGEAICYIKCVQEQVQLLSNPYLKTNMIKDSWMRYET
ncbi:transcription factor bHLH111-like [Bidens hawaiensis]|uniref:transcription factor bHLH111-like n=1 Tax=Bidens hawaiensis TaxID=980011 RepID=UPI0040492A93